MRRTGAKHPLQTGQGAAGAAWALMKHLRVQRRKVWKTWRRRKRKKFRSAGGGWPGQVAKPCQQGGA
eukprot:scaffold237608_cov15-Tisochrysis_lutea.AAC.2